MESVVVSGAVLVSVIIASVVVAAMVSSIVFFAEELVFFLVSRVHPFSWLSGWTSGSSIAGGYAGCCSGVGCGAGGCSSGFDGNHLLRSGSCYVALLFTSPAKRPPALNNYHHLLLFKADDVGNGLFKQTVRI